MKNIAFRGIVGKLDTSLPAPEKGYQILSLEDGAYPEKLTQILGNKAPKQLYYKGNIALLSIKGVGFCGSRNASEKGLETAQDCAEQIASRNLVVVSGNASGIDLKAHYSALKSGGHTIFVLPEGITHFSIKKELKEVWDWSRVLVLSHYEPNAIWQAYRAMERNKIIIALSDAMIVIEAGEKGGTINAGESTLKLGKLLYVAYYEDMKNAPGNDRLLKLGASKLGKSLSTGKAKLAPLLEAIQNNDASLYTPSSKQSSLF